MRVFLLVLLVIASAPLGAQEPLVRPPSAAAYMPFGLDDRWDYVIEEVTTDHERDRVTRERFGIQSFRVGDADTDGERTQYWLYTVLQDARGRVMRSGACRVRMDVETLSSTYWDRWETAVHETEARPSARVSGRDRDEAAPQRNSPMTKEADSAILMAPQEIVSLRIDQLGCTEFEGLVFSEPVPETPHVVAVGEDTYETSYLGRSDMVWEMDRGTTTHSWTFASGLGVVERVETQLYDWGLTAEYTHRLVYARVGDNELGEPLDIGMSYAYGEGLIDYTPKRAVSAAPEDLAIVSAGPNPFRDHLRVGIHVPRPGPVWIDVVDLLGRRVSRTSLGEQRAGTLEHEISGAGMATGVYFIRVEAGEDTATRQVSLMR